MYVCTYLCNLHTVASSSLVNSVQSLWPNKHGSEVEWSFSPQGSSSFSIFLVPTLPVLSSMYVAT